MDYFPREHRIGAIFLSTVGVAVGVDVHVLVDLDGSR
jgi:hypothetical protein